MFQNTAEAKNEDLDPFKPMLFLYFVFLNKRTIWFCIAPLRHALLQIKCVANIGIERL